MEFDVLLRSARRQAGFSQRDLAGEALVPISTISRIEAGETRNPRLQTMVRLLAVTGHRLAIVDVDGTELSHDHPDDRLRDRAGRRFPAHLPTFKISWFDGWWGWFRIAWAPDEPIVSTYGYYHPRKPGYYGQSDQPAVAGTISTDSDRPRSGRVGRRRFRRRFRRREVGRKIGPTVHRLRVPTSAIGVAISIGSVLIATALPLGLLLR